MTRRLRSKVLLGLTAALLALVAAGDDLGGAPDWPSNEFHFVRMYYEGGGYGYGRGRGSWTTDYPEAEYHFTMRRYPKQSGSSPSPDQQGRYQEYPSSRARQGP